MKEEESDSEQVVLPWPTQESIVSSFDNHGKTVNGGSTVFVTLGLGTGRETDFVPLRLSAQDMTRSLPPGDSTIRGAPVSRSVL